MAQIQKQEIRQAIVNAAKSEFILYGIANASMRNIAKKANITVGNIYRYFTNKEELADEIIMPTLTLLNEAIFYPIENQNNNQDAITLFQQKVGQISDGFLHVFENYKQECLILLNYPRFYEQTVLWLYQLIQQLIDKWELDQNNIPYVPQLSMMLAQAIMSGLAKGLNETLVEFHDHPLELKRVINTYLQLFSTMLEAGISYEK